MPTSAPDLPNTTTLDPGFRRDDGPFAVTVAIDRITAPTLAGTRHGFLGRRGGVSTGVHAGLNVGLGSEDDPAAVAENRRRAVEAVAPGARLVSVYQVHGATAVVADAWPDDARPEADALVTNRPGFALGILTADCAPILFADVQAGVIGAAHAGWKGALAGVAQATVEAMERLGADRVRIAAAIGPCIAQRSYEVDDVFRARFTDVDPEHDRFFADGAPGHPRFDLEGFVASCLRASGVTRVHLAGLDTYADPNPEDGARFYSFRRSIHRGEPGYGRQLSLIALAE